MYHITVEIKNVGFPIFFIFYFLFSFIYFFLNHSLHWTTLFRNISDFHKIYKSCP